MKLLLASSSPFRRDLLTRLKIPFETASPDIDESTTLGESPDHYVKRLSISKAQALREQYPKHWIIGSDQCCVIEDEIIGKPHTPERAINQLERSSGRNVTFHTGLCLLAPDGLLQARVEHYTVHFRDLSLTEIKNYVLLEQPLNCAGSFKLEGLGVNLFRSLEGKDPNTLIGLPLISLLEMMRQAGLNPLEIALTSQE